MRDPVRKRREFKWNFQEFRRNSEEFCWIFAESLWNLLALLTCVAQAPAPLCSLSISMSCVVRLDSAFADAVLLFLSANLAATMAGFANR
ncbi:MAG: hypothetical protein WAU00_22745, partial [Caldilinea sp.]